MDEIMKVLVCGGRDYDDINFAFYTLDLIHRKVPITKIIHGDARGADTLGGAWAIKHKIAAQKFPADWNNHAKRAGPIRNQQMLDEGKPDLVVAFPGGVGTRDMIDRAKKAGVRVVEIRSNGVRSNG